MTGNTPVSHQAVLGFCRDRDLCRLIANGVALPAIEEIEAARAARSDVEVRLVSVGRLVAERRHDLLIRVASELCGLYPNLRLTLVGDGPERKPLESIVLELGLGERVRFVGQVPRQEVSSCLRESDIYVSATESDNFANAVIEGAAHGLPVVATRVGFPAEVIEDGRSGYLVEPGSAESLREGLVRLIEDREHRLEVGRRMRERIEELGLTWKACAARTAQLYRDVVAKTGETH